MEIVGRAWAGLFVMLMTLVRPIISWLSKVGEPTGSGTSKERPREVERPWLHGPDHDQSDDREAEQGLHAPGVTQSPPPPPFQPMQQPAWPDWNERVGDDSGWYALENVRIQQRNRAAILASH